jgi:hypothetical protein
MTNEIFTHECDRAFDWIVLIKDSLYVRHCECEQDLIFFCPGCGKSADIIAYEIENTITKIGIS